MLLKLILKTLPRLPISKDVIFLSACVRKPPVSLCFQALFLSGGWGQGVSEEEWERPFMPCQHRTIPHTWALSFKVWNDSLIKVLTASFGRYFNSPFRLQCWDVFLDSQPRLCCAPFPPIAPGYTSSHPKQFLFPSLCWYCAYQKRRGWLTWG